MLVSRARGCILPLPAAPSPAWLDLLLLRINGIRTLLHGRESCLSLP